MKRALTAILADAVLILSLVVPVAAGTFEDAKGAFNKGDYATALRLYRSLADQGNAAAQYTLGNMYDYGKGVQKNGTEASKWYRLAAEQGYAEAQNALGFLCVLEALRTGDYTEAVKWYRLAAEQGDAHGQLALGNSYRDGLGVPQNYVEAAKWFLRAAEQGKDYAAQYMLGLAYARGQGVAQNYVRAYMWLSLAAAKAQPFLKDRDIVAGRINPSQIAEAQKLATEWRPKTANASLEISPASPSPKTLEAFSGTAFFVSNDGVALTNAHVVEGCRYIRFTGVTARLLARDGANDLALLGTDLHPAKWASWRLSLRQGEDIVVYGFPLTGVLSSGGNVVTGNITALAGLEDDSRFLQISAPVQPGNSGGPLFDRYGNVVGVVVAKLNALKIASATGDIPQNVNFAIKASVAVGFLDAQRVTHFDREIAGTLSTPDIAAQAQALAVQVICIR